MHSQHERETTKPFTNINTYIYIYSLLSLVPLAGDHIKQAHHLLREQLDEAPLGVINEFRWCDIK